jgi:uncharacterized protein with HEPN domain
VKDERLYLIHVLECLERIEAYLKDVDEAGFLETPLLQDAVLRNLQVMAESSQRISDESKRKHPEIDWRKLAGFRNVVVHDYLGIELERVWQIIEKDLPPLKKAIEAMLKG